MTDKTSDGRPVPLQVHLSALRNLAARLPSPERIEWEKALDAVSAAVSDAGGAAGAAASGGGSRDWARKIGGKSLHALLDALPSCLAILDSRFNFVEVNSAYCAGSGCSRESLIGHNHFVVFPHPENQAIFERARESREPASVIAKPFENPRQRERGTTYWDWTLAPLGGDGCQGDLLALALTDVTDRIRVQEELKKQRDFTSAVLETAGALVVVLDLQGRIVRFNGACERATGYKFAEVEGKCFWDFLIPSHEVDAVRKVFGSLRAGKFPNEHENEWVAKDGSRRLIAWSNTALTSPDGEVEFVIGTGIDVTERRRAEKELEASAARLKEQAKILDHAQVMIEDMESKIIFWNKGAERLYGWSREEAFGRTTEDLLHSVLPVPRESIMDQLLREGRWRGELRQTCRDGRQIVLASLWVLHRNEGGQPVAILKANNDITEAKRLEEALRKSQKELAVRNRIAEILLSMPQEEIYSPVLQVILEALESKRGLFGYIDDHGNLVCPSLSTDVWDQCDVPGKSIVFPREKWGGLWGRCLAEKRPGYLNSGLHVPAGHIHLERALAMPIVFGGELIGLVVVADKETDYGEDDARRLETICGHLAAILHARRQRDEQYHARKQAEDALHRLQRQLGDDQSFAGIVGRHPRMLDLFETIKGVAEVDVPVLIQGESGTGKELVAAAIHSQGLRADKPFIPVNCSALPASLLESELFGHVRGAFSGAIRDKKGRFELADGGTIFLDEIGDLDLPVQVSLLRVLQEGTIERVGGEQIQKVNVRVISATNKNLQRLVVSGKFREDLYYRLCVVPIHVPSLRERREDIPLLSLHFLDHVVRTTGRKELVFSREALSALQAHHWPGNVRELQNAIHFASVKCKGGILEPIHFPPAISRTHTSTTRPVKSGRKPKLSPEAVEKLLREVDGNKKEAARRLGVCRTTLYKYIAARPRT